MEKKKSKYTRTILYCSEELHVANVCNYIAVEANITYLSYIVKVSVSKSKIMAEARNSVM
jgi:hypothetical protein